MGQSIDQMHFRPNRPLTSRRGGFDLLDDIGRAAGQVGLLNDFPATLGMNDDSHVRIFLAHLIDMLGPKELVNGTVALPKHKVRLS